MTILTKRRTHRSVGVSPSVKGGDPTKLTQSHVSTDIGSHEEFNVENTRITFCGSSRRAMFDALPPGGVCVGSAHAAMAPSWP